MAEDEQNEDKIDESNKNVENKEDLLEKIDISEERNEKIPTEKIKEGDAETTNTTPTEDIAPKKIEEDVSAGGDTSKNVGDNEVENVDVVESKIQEEKGEAADEGKTIEEQETIQKEEAIEKNASVVEEIPQGKEQLAEQLIEEGDEGQEGDEAGGEEMGLDEGDGEEGIKSAKSIEIEIPDLYEDGDDVSLPDLLDDVRKKPAKEETKSTDNIDIVLDRDQSVDEVELAGEMGSEEMEYEDLSVGERYDYLGEMEDEISPRESIKEKLPIKKVGIVDETIDKSDLDIFFHLVEKDELAEDIEEKDKKKSKQEATYTYELSGVRELLDSLIERTVEKSERIDPEAVLRLKLDRVKLMKALKIALAEIQEEHNNRFFLNRKVVEFFRRKKYDRALVVDNPDNIMNIMKRYRESMVKLDAVQTQEGLLKEQCETRLDIMRKSESTLRAIVVKKVESLNKRLKEVGMATASKTNQPMSEKVK